MGGGGGGGTVGCRGIEKGEVQENGKVGCVMSCKKQEGLLSRGGEGN